MTLSVLDTQPRPPELIAICNASIELRGFFQRHGSESPQMEGQRVNCPGVFSSNDFARRSPSAVTGCKLMTDFAIKERIEV